MVCFVISVFLICLGIWVKECKGDLRELAHNKEVTLNSTWYENGKYNAYPGRNAVNGNLNDFSHTALEDSPWMTINLGKHYLIHEIEVFARRDCCPEQLHDLSVKVGTNKDKMKLCGHVTGHAQMRGQRIGIWCPHNTVGQFVKLEIVQRGSRRSVLAPAEVLVWGREHVMYRIN